MARVRTLAGRAIEQHNSPNRGGRMSDHRGVVLHIAQGSYRGTINWQNNPDQRYADGTRVTTCSTWIVGREPGEWAQMVDSDEIAWCQRDGSRTWLSIELAGFAPAAPTAWQIEACAQLLAWSARTHRHPIAVADHPGERGLGHHSMDRESFGEQWGHDECPGSGVIGAKAAIVARAKQIMEGDDDMPSVEDFFEHQFGAPGQGVKKRRFYEWVKVAASAGPNTDKLLAEAKAAKLRDEAILAAVQGASSVEVLARIDRRAAEEAERDAQARAELVALLEQAAVERAELAELVGQGMSGELAAEEVLRRMGEKLAAGSTDDTNN